MDTPQRRGRNPSARNVVGTENGAALARHVDRSTGECQLATSADGANFDSPRTVYVLGATAGRQARQMLVLMHEVKVGLKMELGVGDLEPRNRQITGEVQAIKLVE